MATSTSYLGLTLPHPFIAGASPFGYHLDEIRRLEDAGWAAIVLPSIFEEQVTLRDDEQLHGIDVLDTEFRDVLAQYPDAAAYQLTPDAYVEHVSRVKRAVKIPIIASLNGTTSQAWLAFAKELEQAGADALEVNFYRVAAGVDASGPAVEHEIVRVAESLAGLLTIPIAVKLPPFFTAFGSLAARLEGAGARGLVLFNRFYQPDIDPETMAPLIRVRLSTSDELPLRLQWLALLYGRVSLALAASGGIHAPSDAIKAILAGATAVQMVSAILRHGPAHLSLMRMGLESWMDRHRISHLGDMRGLASAQRNPDADAFERGAYIRMLQSWSPKPGQ